MYAKIFDSMYEGTLYGHWEAIVTLQQMLVLCDPAGVIDMTPQAIAGKTSIPIEIILKGIEVLTSPDPHSRTPGEDGRRIATIDEHRPWGWYIVNHAKYQRLKSAKEKREADRVRMAEKRNTNKSSHVATSRAASPEVAKVAHSDSDVDTDLNTDATAVKAKSKVKPIPVAPKTGAPEAQGKTVESWNAYSAAYRQRYSVDPVRNARVNGQLGKLVAQLGAEEAPMVAAFYLTHNGGLYVSSGHCVDLLLRDCAKLRTEMMTGRKITRVEARNAEEMDAVRQQADRVGKMLADRKVAQE